MITTSRIHIYRGGVIFSYFIIHLYTYTNSETLNFKRDLIIQHKDLGRTFKQNT